MNTGAWACGILACIFGILVIILSLLKEKGAMLVSGFNTLSKKKEICMTLKQSQKIQEINFLSGLVSCL